MSGSSADVLSNRKGPRSSRDSSDRLDRILALLSIGAGAAIIGCVVYCAVWWQPHPMSWTDLDCSLACWAFCATQSSLWALMALGLAVALAGTGILLWKQPYRYARTALVFGILTLPFGAVALLPFLRYRVAYGSGDSSA